MAALSLNRNASMSMGLRFGRGLASGGGGGGEVTLTNATLSSSSSDTGPNNTSVRLLLRDTGNLEFVQNGVFTQFTNQWLTNAWPYSGDQLAFLAVTETYEIRFTLVSGDTPNLVFPDEGTWLQYGAETTGLATAEVRYISSVSDVGVQTRGGVIRVELRKAGETEIRGSAEFTMSATSEYLP